MSSKLRSAGVVGLAVALAITLAGCNTVRGGGWMRSATGSGKATFGFELVCKNDTSGQAQISGQLEYEDPSAGISFHGRPGQLPAGSSCGTLPAGTGQFYGTYTPQPANRGPGGTFVIIATDSGAPGPSKGDFFSISLVGGVYDGYTNSGNLGGGNIQSFDR